MSKHKKETAETSTHEEYPDRASGRNRRERESVKIAMKAQVGGQPMHKIGEVIPREDGSVASGRLGGVNSNMEPNDSTSEEEKLRATSNDGEAQASA
jgi:hypothetical protein